jgi:hypothetical protein
VAAALEIGAILHDFAGLCCQTSLTWVLNHHSHMDEEDRQHFIGDALPPVSVCCLLLPAAACCYV